MEKFPERKFNKEQEEMLNDVLSSAPKLGETEVAELFDKMKLSREQFKHLLEITKKDDEKLIDRWLELAEKRAGGEFEVHNEKKQ